MFRCGLFENPYLDPEGSRQVVGCREFEKEGYEAQLKSVVMLKNKGVLPAQKRWKVYIPDRYISARKGFFRNDMPGKEIDPIEGQVLAPYFERVREASQADAAIVFIESPLSDGYSEADVRSGGNGYLPVMLQYRPYCAEYARKESIAGGDFRENFVNRSYYGKANRAANESDLDLVLEARKKMGDKPVIVCIRMHNPAVLAELEGAADAILVDFGVQQEALLDIMTGKAEPGGLLPVQLPADMRTVEEHGEDTGFDMIPYRDSVGNVYDFGFGLDWKGRIQDERTEKYRKR